MSLDKTFREATAWQPLPASHGFDVAVFEANLADGKGAIACAAFVQYRVPLAGHYEYPDGPGYKQRVLGLYCPKGGFPSTRADSDSMKALDDTLAEIRTPPP